MKKALMTSSVASMIKQFNMSNIQILQDLGYEVTVGTNFENPGTIPMEDSRKLVEKLHKINVKTLQLNMQRNPLHPDNILVLSQLSELLDENYFDLIHCHSPIGGVITRLAARKTRKKGTKVIYTAHGFHFFSGSPKVNWILYPVEKELAKITDVLITINKEDYERANSWKNCKVEKVSGVGVDTTKYINCNVDRTEIRKEIGVPKDSFLVLSVGELSTRKNHIVGIEALNLLRNNKIHYIICGQGEQELVLKEKVMEYGLENNVHFLGYRNDLPEIYNISDVFLFASKREGLGLAGIEAMASGLPILTSNLNGINDYSQDKVTGFQFDPDDIEGFAEGIKKIMNLSTSKKKKIGENNKEKAYQFDSKFVNENMVNIYNT